MYDVGAGRSGTGDSADWGVIPEDERVIISSNRGEPLVAENPLAGIAFDNIARRWKARTIEFLNLVLPTVASSLPSAAGFG